MSPDEIEDDDDEAEGTEVDEDGIDVQGGDLLVTAAVDFVVADESSAPFLRAPI